MTLEKIKFYMDERIFNFWTKELLQYSHEEQKETLQKASEQLKSDINNGLAVGIKYQAELKLINHLLN